MTSQACQVYSPQVPIQWASPDFAEAACAAPDCGDNRAAFETCCTGEITSFNPSQQTGANSTATGILAIRQDESGSTSDIQYLACSIDADTANWDPLSTEPSPYLNYQNCLLNSGSQYFKCNMPRGETLNDCPTGMQTAPVGNGEITCNTRNVPNATAILGNCCDSDPQVYGYGCYTWCSGDSGLQQCIDDNNNDDAPAIFCRASNEIADDNSEVDPEEDMEENPNDTSGAASAIKKTNIMGYGLVALLFVHMLL